jgi:hypothetical protein
LNELSSESATMVEVYVNRYGNHESKYHSDDVKFQLDSVKGYEMGRNYSSDCKINLKLIFKKIECKNGGLD